MPHPVERVWRAVSEPSELAQWFVVELTVFYSERFGIPRSAGVRSRSTTRS